MLFFLIFGKPLTLWVLFLPVSLLVQFIFTLGFCFLISALTVHFRDIKDILSNLMTLWFFATPIIYTYESVPKALKMVLESQPHDPYDRVVPLCLLLRLAAALEAALGHRAGRAAVFFYLGYLIFDKLRDTFVEEV